MPDPVQMMLCTCIHIFSCFVTVSISFLSNVSNSWEAGLLENAQFHVVTLYYFLVSHPYDKTTLTSELSKLRFVHNL